MINSFVSWTKRRSRALGRFLSHTLATDRRGTVGIVFAATIIPVTASIGMAVDLGQAVKIKSDLQSTLDAVALATGRTLQTTSDEAAAETYARQYFAGTVPSGLEAEITHLAIDSATSTVTLAAVARVETGFLAMIGVDRLMLTAAASAGMGLAGSGKDLEVAMMLDITGSMGGQKLTDLKLAAKDLVQSLLPDAESREHTRIAVVPFSEAVRPGNDVLANIIGAPPAMKSLRDASGRTRTYTLTACVSERLGTDAFTDATPAGGSWIGPVYTLNGSCLPSSTVLPLTSEKAALDGKIDGLSANGYTAGQIGTAWAWYALSPNWADIWPMGSEPAAYSGNVTKVAVLMTDGEYNTGYRHGVDTRAVGGAPDNGSSDEQARQMCEAMKAEGVVVYTVGFQLEDANAVETLERCASGGSYAFLADNGSELRQAFRDIAFRLADLKLTR